MPEPPLEIANSLRDASPDAWGRRVIAHRFVSGRDGAGEMVDFDELTFMLQSGSDRIGALDAGANEIMIVGIPTEDVERYHFVAEEVLSAFD